MIAAPTKTRKRADCLGTLVFHVPRFTTLPAKYLRCWSDHRSFWRESYRAVMITDTAFYRYRHYHQPSDTPDKLAYSELARVTAGLFAAFSELASGGVD